MKSIVLHNLLAGPGVADISPDSNLWHVRNYEVVADKVYVLFLAETIPGKKILRNGNTILIAVGSRSLMASIFFSPFRLYKLVKRIRPELTSTYEQVFVWWTIAWVRRFTRTVNIMIPIALPDKIYEITKKSLSGRLPIWLEKIFRRWSMKAVTNVVTTKSLGDYKKWLLNDRTAKKKTVVFDKLPEEAPSLNFLSDVSERKPFPTAESAVINLIIVGRLRKEKLADHAILALAELLKKDPRYRLYLIGEGEELNNLKALAEQHGISSSCFFEGYRNTRQIINYCRDMDVFVSPYTGGALREAALLRLPIVAYNTDWIRDELQPDIEYAAAEFMDYRQLAEKIEQVVKDPNFAAHIVSNMYAKAQRLWTLTDITNEFEKVLRPAS